MDKKNILQDLNKIFQEVFNDDSLEIKGNTTANDVDGWDSITNIKLILAQEDFFKVRYDLAELSELSNVQDLVDLLHPKLS